MKIRVPCVPRKSCESQALGAGLFSHSHVHPYARVPVCVQSSDFLSDMVISGSKGVVMQYTPKARQADDVRAFCGAATVLVHAVVILKVRADVHVNRAQGKERHPSDPPALLTRARGGTQGVDWQESYSIADDGKRLPSFDGVKLKDADAKSWNLKAISMLNLDTKRKKYILAVGTEGYCGIYDGIKWTRKTNGLPTSHTYEAAYMPTKDTMIIATGDGKIYKSSNAGDDFKLIGAEEGMKDVFDTWGADLGGRSVIKMAGESCLAQIG